MNISPTLLHFKHVSAMKNIYPIFFRLIEKTRKLGWLLRNILQVDYVHFKSDERVFHGGDFCMDLSAFASLKRDNALAGLLPRRMLRMSRKAVVFANQLRVAQLLERWRRVAAGFAAAALAAGF